MSAIAGWYPDPAGSPHLRWWDGSGWTSTLTPAVPTDTARPFPTLTGSQQPVMYPQYAPAYSPRPYLSPRRPWYRRRPFVGLVSGIAVLAVVLVVAGVGVFADEKEEARALAARTTIRAPGSVAGFPKIESAAVNALFTEVDSLPMFNGGVTHALYGAAASRPAFLVVAAKLIVPRSHLGDELDSFEIGIRRNLPAGTTFSPVDPGPLGGKMECASIEYRLVPIRVCSFADSAALGAVFQYDSEASNTALAVSVRSEIEIRK